MNTNFEIEQTNILDRVKTGHASIGVKINGYWSYDPVRIYVRRNYGWNTASPEWTTEVVHSSGGRDPKQVEDDLDAEENFGNALIAAAKYARELRGRAEEFEKAYQAHHIEVENWAKEEAAKKQAKIDADPALTEVQIEELVENLKTKNGSIALVERGSDGTRVIKISAMHGTRLTFYMGRYRIARAKMLEILSNASARTQFVES